MRSRWVDAAAVLGGALAIPALAWLFLLVFAAFAYGRFEEGSDWVAVAVLVFTLLTVPMAVLVVWTGNRRQREIAPACCSAGRHWGPGSGWVYYLWFKFT
jgi:hypothetical protein